jgi:hypothetical protein
MVLSQNDQVGNIMSGKDTSPPDTEKRSRCVAACLTISSKKISGITEANFTMKANI